jgi:ABC-type glutathione transport system ATPase component
VARLWRSRRTEIEARAEELLGASSWTTCATSYAGTLSGGQRKLLEMARALMVEPTMVMLDEPMAGVNPALTQSLLGHVKDLPDEGMTVLFVEHDMDVVMDISDWVVVMAQGRIIAEGPPQCRRARTGVIDAYLGSTATRPLHDSSPGPDPEGRDRSPTPADAPRRGVDDVGRAERPTDGDETGGRRSDPMLIAEDVTPATCPASTSSPAATSRSSEGELVGIIGPTAPASPRCSRPCSAWSTSARAR